MENPTQETPLTKQPVKEAGESIKPLQPSRTPLIVMAILTTLSLIVAGYLGYQNYLLRQQISQVQATPSPTVSTPSPTTDSTADWEIYTGKYFSFKYPPDWEENNDPSNTNSDNLESVNLRISPNAVFEANHRDYSYEEQIQALASRESQKITLEGREATRFELAGTGQALPLNYSIISIIVEGSSNTSFAIIFNGDNKDIEDSLVNQILSTFKFLE